MTLQATRSAPLMSAMGVPPWTRAQLPSSSPLPSQTDMLIVGAGLTGLWLALALAARGQTVTVIDREFGAGASGRSGGVVLGETLIGPDPAFDGCEHDLRQWLDAHHIECEATWTGCLELARRPSLSARPIAWRDAGSIRLVARRPGGALNPARLTTELARTALAAGVAIVDHVEVLDTVEGDGELVTTTDAGSLRSRVVLMAVDTAARADGFDPWPERILTVALRTARLPQQTLATLGLEMLDAFYTDDLPLLWGRVLSDATLLIGRETIRLDDPQPPHLETALADAEARLARRVRGLHRVLADVNVQQVWCGPIARTVAGIPAIVSDPALAGRFWLGGYGGHGIAQAFRLAQFSAEQLAPLVAGR